MQIIVASVTAKDLGTGVSYVVILRENDITYFHGSGIFDNYIYSY